MKPGSITSRKGHVLITYHSVAKKSLHNFEYGIGRISNLPISTYASKPNSGVFSSGFVQHKGITYYVNGRNEVFRTTVTHPGLVIFDPVAKENGIPILFTKLHKYEWLLME